MFSTYTIYFIVKNVKNIRKIAVTEPPFTVCTYVLRNNLIEFIHTSRYPICIKKKKKKIRIMLSYDVVRQKGNERKGQLCAANERNSKIYIIVTEVFKDNLKKKRYISKCEG